MINSVSFIFFILISFSIGLPCSPQEKQKYREAYEYIKADSVNEGKTFYVFDSIADTDRYFFREDINKVLGQNKTERDYWRYTWEVAQYSPLLESLFHEENDSDAEKIVVFSDIDDDNILIAEVWDRKKHSSWGIGSIDWQRSYNDGKIYLFIFGKDQNLIYTNSVYMTTD